MSSPKAYNSGVMPNDLVVPTPERFQRGNVERLDRIQDDEGRPSRPHRAIDILSSMERRGAITAAMRLAGEDFRIHFRKAYCGDLKVLDIAKPFVSGTRVDGYAIGSIAARKAIREVMDIVGGEFTQAGSILWHVIGLDWSIKQWAQMYSSARLRKVSEEAASGILIGALCPLVKYYGYSA